ncbi:MAG: hypothetical protein IJF69_02100 [Clostridia bacterium]|nr:hypothetical protein [Clostridia bacterium]
MKKILAILLAMMMLLSFAACTAGNGDADDTTDAVTTDADDKGDAGDTTDAGDDAKVMTYAEYDAAELDSKVVIEAYVQATQSWWDNKITVYTQDKDGAYFIYELACTEEDSAKLVPGTKIRVTGFKSEWSGEVEITDGTFEFVEDADTYIADATDVTDLLGTDDLIKHQNKFVCFKGMTVKNITYKNDKPGDDIYVTVTKDGADYSFCVEMYLTAPTSDTYLAVSKLVEGDIVDIEGFLYWYEGVNTHITGVTKVEG